MSCGPCIQLRCSPTPTDNAVRTDLFSNKCVTLTCPDGSGEVTRCARFGTVLYNASAETIASVQATLDAAALTQATNLATAALTCPPAEFENTLQSVDMCDYLYSGTSDSYGQSGGDSTLHPDGTYLENGFSYATAGSYTASTQEAADNLAEAAAIARIAEYLNSGGNPQCCANNDPQYPQTIGQIHNWNDPNNFPQWFGYEPNPPPNIDGGDGTFDSPDPNGYDELDAFICNPHEPYEVTITVNILTGTPDNTNYVYFQCGGATLGDGAFSETQVYDHLGVYTITRTIPRGPNYFVITITAPGTGTITIHPLAP